MKKDQLDLPNAVVWIPDSKTPNGIADTPLTPFAVDAFRDQLSIAGDGPFLFPSDLNPTGHQAELKTVWQKSLWRAKVPLLPDLRFAIHACHSPQCGRRSRRVDDIIASPGQLSSLQALLAHETANQERSSGENQPPG